LSNLSSDSDEYLVQRQQFKPRPVIPPHPPKAKLGNIKVFENGIKATNWDFGQKQFSDENFSFRTLEVTINDDRGNELPAYTIGQYVINGNKKTKWVEYNVNALYYIRQGEGWFMIGEDGKTLGMMYYVCVPAGTRHCILNKSTNVTCIVELTFPGKIMIG
jgi:mannose-6-phosphate isomerase-like protein (cupin superfamily)